MLNRGVSIYRKLWLDEFGEIFWTLLAVSQFLIIYHLIDWQGLYLKNVIQSHWNNNKCFERSLTYYYVCIITQYSWTFFNWLIPGTQLELCKLPKGGLDSVYESIKLGTNPIHHYISIFYSFDYRFFLKLKIVNDKT